MKLVCFRSLSAGGFSDPSLVNLIVRRAVLLTEPSLFMMLNLREDGIYISTGVLLGTFKSRLDEEPEFRFIVDYFVFSFRFWPWLSFSIVLCVLSI